jgi:hypothetical protein
MDIRKFRSSAALSALLMFAALPARAGITAFLPQDVERLHESLASAGQMVPQGLLTSLFATACLLLALGSAVLLQFHRRQHACFRADRERWEEERLALSRARDFAVEALATVEETAIAMLDKLADEVERSVGHTNEAYLLEALARDMRRSRWHSPYLSSETECLLQRCGIDLSARSGHVGNVMRLALQVTDRVTDVERRNHEVTRLCQIYPRDRAKWLSEALSRYERLCGSPDEARREFRAVMAAWERVMAIGDVRGEMELRVELASAIGEENGQPPPAQAVAISR